MILADPAVRVFGRLKRARAVGVVSAGATVVAHPDAMRPLPVPCYWIESEGGAFLRWNAGTVGCVKPTATGALVVIQWRETYIEAQVASMSQGRRYLAQWVAARRGFPGKCRR